MNSNKVIIFEEVSFMLIINIKRHWPSDNSIVTVPQSQKKSAVVLDGFISTFYSPFAT